MVATRDSSKAGKEAKQVPSRVSEEGNAGKEINETKSTKGYEFDKLSSEINSINTTLQDMIKSFDDRTAKMDVNVQKSCNTVRTELNDNLDKQNLRINDINNDVKSIKESITNNTNNNNTNDIVKRLDNVDDKIEIISKSQHTEVDNNLEKLTVILDSELAAHTKHISDRHESLEDETKLVISDIRVDMGDIRVDIDTLRNKLTSSSTIPNIHKASCTKPQSSNPNYIPNVKWHLSEVKFLDTKNLNSHLENLKITGDTIQDMMLLHSNVKMIVFVGTNGTVDLPLFENLNESFSYRKFLVPQNSSPDYVICRKHYDYFAILIASRLKNGLADNSIILPKAKEAKAELELFRKSSDGFDMAWSVISHLVPRLGHNSLKYDPATIINTLRTTASGSYKSYHSKAQDIEETLYNLKEDFAPHKLIIRYLEQLHNTMNYKYAVTAMLIGLRKHIKKYGDASVNICHHDSILVTIETMRDETLEHSIDDIFKIDTSLICKEVNVTLNNKITDNNDCTEINTDYDYDLSSYKNDVTKKHNNKKNFALRPRCVVCTLRHWNSDDPDKCPFRGDAFRAPWMSVRMKKCNADHGSQPKKVMQFSSPPPMEATITKSLESRKAVSFEPELVAHGNTDNDVDYHNNAQSTTPDGNLELSSMMADINCVGEDFLCCGRSSFDYDSPSSNATELSSSDEQFSLIKPVNKDNINHQPSSFVASSEESSFYSTKDMSNSSSKFNVSRILSHVDSGSNVMLVTSPAMLHNVTSCDKTVGNTGGGNVATTHIGELHLLLETSLNKKLLVIMKQTYAMPSNQHNTLGLSPFKLHGCDHVSHSMYEHVDIDFKNNNKVNLPIAVIKNYLDYVSLKITLPTKSHKNINNESTKSFPQCFRVQMTKKH